METGETFQQLAEAKYALEDNVRQNFLEPLRQLETKDLKEISVSLFIGFVDKKIATHFKF